MKWLFFLIPCVLFSFEKSPWFDDIAEFQLRPSYAYSYYPSIQGVEKSYSSHDQIFDLNLGVRFQPNWEVQVQVDFAHTKRSFIKTRRLGAQVRYLLLDDVAGDLLSLTLGGQFFYVPGNRLRDLSSPYHARWNGEMGVGFGKELTSLYNYLIRFSGFLGLGRGDKGKGWVSPELAIECKVFKKHRLKLFSQSYLGLGKGRTIDVKQFSGYGEIEHRSIDVGMGYTYAFDIWGELSLEYFHRVFAQVFPEKKQTLILSYRLPFSIF